MKVTKRILSLLLALTMLFALAACKEPADTTGATNPGATGGNGASSDKGNYTVKLETAGGMALVGYQINVYSDEACQNLVDIGTTDSKGTASWSLKKDAQYYFQLDNSQLKGYDVKNVYAFSGATTKVTLTSALIQGEDPASNVFKVGDVMYDFSFEDNSKVICAACGVTNDSYVKEIVVAEDGTEDAVFKLREKCESCQAVVDWDHAQFPKITLSEVLAEKEMVMLNFWYTTCSACLTEFPVLDTAYSQMADKIAVLGLNSYARDNQGAVTGFEASYELELSFPLGKVDNNFNNEKFIDPLDGAPSEGYPTSVFIDRYGLICLIVEGSIDSLTEWTSLFNHFTGDDYEQKLITNSDDLITRPEAPAPSITMEELAGVMNGSDDLQVEYRWEADDKYSWPYNITEKDGQTCLVPTNVGIYESYAILYADITLEKGQVIAFDYFASSEQNYDVMYVIVNDEPIYNLSGVKNEWQTAYCWIADEPGTYELALCYQKDTDGDEGDDAVYIKNLRTVTVDDIDTPSYLPRQAANMREDGTFSYVDLVLNEQDGYYHVGSANGPLLLAGLYDYTQFSDEDYIYRMAADGEIKVDDHDYYADLVEYFSASTNSNLVGWCTVTEELAELLKIVASIKGYTGDEQEWLLFCKYYDAYGTNGQQLEDPVAGLKTWSALTAVEGVGVETNTFNYNGNPLIPRGKLARFTPTKSGVYRITSTSDYADTMDAWIFDDDYNMLYQYENDEMLGYLYCDDRNVSMVMYMEAGKNYYIDIAPYDVYAVCNVWYDIVFLGETFDLFRACSPGPFTYIEGGGADHAIIRGINTVLNPEDGYYHEDLGKDADGNQIYGSIVYAYFAGGTVSFGNALADRIDTNEDGTTKVIPGLISLGAFDFSKNEYDDEILAYLRNNNNDQEATLEALRKDWGTDFEANYEFYKVEEVFAGIYHGEGGDYTAEMQVYVDLMIQDEAHPELNGCVPVDARLAELLQMAMDKFTFRGVEQAWQKFCFYYDQLGPRA